MVLDIPKYFATAKCTKVTSVYWIHKDQYVRLFRKKNPHSLKPMAKTLAMLMQSRSGRDSLVTKIPLLKCVIWKLQEISGQIKRIRVKKEEESPLLLLPETVGSSSLSRPKSHTSNRSVLTTRGDSESYSVSSFRSAHLPVLSDKATFTRSTALGGGSGLVYSMPNLKRNDAERAHTAHRHSFGKGDGIYMKLLQVGNPNLNRKHLDIGDDELEYLISLRRRMARKLEEFHPNSRLDELYGDGGSKRQKGRGRSQPKNDGGAVLPALKGGKQTLISRKERLNSPTKKKPRGILFKID